MKDTMHTQRYALSDTQRHQLHRLGNAIIVAIPIPLDAPEAFDLDLFVFQSLPREPNLVIREASETSLAVLPSTRPSHLGQILTDRETHRWHIAVPVVLATLGSSLRKNGTTHPNPQWPGDLSLVWHDNDVR